MAIVALSAVTALFNPTFGQKVDNPELGYSFRIPDGWCEIPKPVVQRFQQALIKPGVKPDFIVCAAYEPATHANYFDLPYILVQQSPYAEGVERMTISEDDLIIATAEISGSAAGAVQSARKDMTPEASKLLNNMQYQGAKYSTQPPAISFGAIISTPDGQLHCGAKLLIGRHRRVALDFYASVNDPKDYSSAQQEAIDSFQLEPNEQIAFGSGAKSLFDNVIPAAITGAILAVVGSLFGRSRRRRTPNGNDAPPTLGST